MQNNTDALMGSSQVRPAVRITKSLTKVVESTVFITLSLLIVFLPSPVEEILQDTFGLTVLLDPLKAGFFLVYLIEFVVSNRTLSRSTLLFSLIALTVLLGALLNVAVDKSIVAFLVQLLFPVVITARYLDSFKSLPIAVREIKVIQRFLVIAFIIFSLFLIVNIVSLIFFPYGIYHRVGFVNGNREMYRVFFLGNKNSIILPTLCQFLLGLGVSRIFGWKWIVPVDVLLVLVSAYLSDSSTTIVAILFALVISLAFFVIRGFREHIRQILTALYIGMLSVTIAISLFQIMNLAGKIGTDSQQRWITFTHRVEIWEKAWVAISNSPIFGHGSSGDLMVPALDGFSTPHNTVLFFLYAGGVVALIIFSILFINLISMVNVSDVRLFQVFLPGVFSALLVWMLMESINSSTSFLVFCLYLLPLIPKTTGLILMRRENTPSIRRKGK